MKKVYTFLLILAVSTSITTAQNSKTGILRPAMMHGVAHVTI